MAWTKVNREKEDWTKVDRVDMGWLINGWLVYGWLLSSLWGIVSKLSNGWEKVNKE